MEKIIITGVLFGIISTILTTIYNRMVSRKLNKRFVSLGDMTGMHLSQIIDVVGSPNARYKLEDGTLCKWASPTYQIEIMVDKNGYFSYIKNEVLE